MQKNSILAVLFILFFSGCVSVLSQMSDEEAWNNYFKEYKAQQQKDDRSLASDRTNVKILRQILDEMPFRSYLISCDNRDCYQSQLVIAYDQAFRRVKDQNISLTSDEYTIEQKNFLDHYSYEKVLSWIEAFHRMLLSGVELRTAQRAVELAHNCDSSLNSESETHLQNFAPYLGGITYLPRAYYSCLNDHWSSEIDQLLKETTDRLGIVIKTEEAKRWILQRQITPIYRKTLNDIYVKRKQEEMDDWNQDWKITEGKIDWKKSTEEIISSDVPQLRKQFHYINLEAILTEKKQSKR